MTFEPRNLQRHARFVRFEDTGGLEFEVHGDDFRLQVACEIAGTIQSLIKQGERLLSDFMKHAGKFTALFVEVFATPEDDGGGFRIRYAFETDADPHEFGYTYFDVVFSIHDPPGQRFWPIKFVVGFW